MLLDERGFGSIEFIFVTLIALLVIGGMLSVVNTETNQTQSGNLAQQRATGEKIAEVINTVYINGMGYNIALSIPTGMTVNVNVPTGYLTIQSTTTGKNITVKLIPQNVQNTTLNGGNMYNVTYNNTGTINFYQL